MKKITIDFGSNFVQGPKCWYFIVNYLSFFYCTIEYAVSLGPSYKSSSFLTKIHPTVRCDLLLHLEEWMTFTVLLPTVPHEHNFVFKPPLFIYIGDYFQFLLTFTHRTHFPNH